MGLSVSMIVVRISRYLLHMTSRMIADLLLRKYLEENVAICLSNDGNELYGRSWNKEVNENEDEL